VSRYKILCVCAEREKGKVIYERGPAQLDQRRGWEGKRQKDGGGGFPGWVQLIGLHMQERDLADPSVWIGTSER